MTPKVGISKVGRSNSATNVEEMMLWVEPLSTNIITVWPKIVPCSFMVDVELLPEKWWSEIPTFLSFSCPVLPSSSLRSRFHKIDGRPTLVSRHEAIAAAVTETLFASLLSLVRIAYCGKQRPWGRRGGWSLIRIAWQGRWRSWGRHGRWSWSKVRGRIWPNEIVGPLGIFCNNAFASNATTARSATTAPHVTLH